jgi:hypothetical protein
MSYCGHIKIFWKFLLKQKNWKVYNDCGCGCVKEKIPLEKDFPFFSGHFDCNGKRRRRKKNNIDDIIPTKVPSHSASIFFCLYPNKSSPSSIFSLSLIRYSFIYIQLESCLYRTNNLPKGKIPINGILLSFYSSTIH